MKVTTNIIKEIHICQLQKTTIENLTKMESTSETPKLFWCNGILFIAVEFGVDELEVKKTQGIYYLDKFFYSECKEKIDQAKYNGSPIEVIDYTGDSVFENLINFLEAKK